MANKPEYVTTEQYKTEVLTSDGYVRFADTFNSEHTQALVKKSINILIEEAICKDKNIKESITNLVNDIDRKDAYVFWKKFGWAIWSVVLVILGAFLGNILGK